MNMEKWAKKNNLVSPQFNFVDESKNEELENRKWRNLQASLIEQWQPGTIITSGDGETQYRINSKGCRERITPKPLSKRAKRRHK